MSTDMRRGMTLLEVMVALALLGVSALGLMGGMVVASSTNGISRRRTHMLEFGHARIERLASRTRVNVPTQTTTTPVTRVITLTLAPGPSRRPRCVTDPRLIGQETAKA